MDDAKKVDHDHGKLKPCPKEFIEIGAASILLKYDIRSGDAKEADFDHVLSMIRANYKTFKAHGFAEMESAKAERKFIEAQRAYAADDREMAEVLAREGHDHLRSKLVERGFHTPTDDDIKVVHAKQLAEAKAAASTNLPTVARGDSR